MQYSHKAIEKKWQKFWEENKTYKTTNNSSKKAYVLDMFPYPSGSGLHVGHPKGYTASDIIARLRRMQGYDVLHPIGWDAFGLPAEQYALQTGNDPAEFTLKNIDNFRTQLKALGFSFDYDKEVNTSSPNYYRNTQWIFNQLYKNGLAEQKEVDVNWCEELGTVLANEEVLVENGKMVSERGSFPVVKRPMKQWILKITNYAERLISDLDELDWPESIKELQRNWIGKSEGVEISFAIENSDQSSVEVFTTRADTICGVTYLVLAPEHKLVKQIADKNYLSKVGEFIEYVKTKTDLERQDNSKEKNGMFIGAYAINPVTKEKLPIWIADYVLPTYATGAVMAVPAHDERDFVFAEKYHLPIKYVIEGFNEGKVFVKDGKHLNSLFLNGLTTSEAIKIVGQFLIKENKGKFKVNYKLRDWLFSRQRYWGEPFPIIHWEDNTITLVEDDQLPLQLPKMTNITLSKTGESPLANATQWLSVEKNNIKGKRETNTMPQWAGSCWYYLGYILTRTTEDIIDIESDLTQDLFKKWLPVDLYIGGQEHAVLHLLYARFWHKFLYDVNIVPTKEPFYKLVNQGMILGENNEKMSKSKGNVINPDDIVKSHGADALRLYEMFMGPINASLAWSAEGLDGARKWLDRVYRLFESIEIVEENNTNLDFAYHNMVKNVTNLLEKLDFNNAVSQMMIFINAVYKQQQVYKPYLQGFCQILSLYAPHLAEELWEKLGHHQTITYQPWPEYDEKYLIKDNLIIPVQVNGKLKATLEVAKDIDQDELIQLAESQPNVINALKERTILKKVVVPGKIINFVVE